MVDKEITYMAETETNTRPMAVHGATESVVKQPEFRRSHGNDCIAPTD
jgi:hypothetical protein